MGLARLAAMAVLLLIAPGHGQRARAQSELQIGGLRLPLTIGGFMQRGPVRNFEASSPGLGASAAYYGPGWTLTIYVYDKRMARIPEGSDNEVVGAELQMARRDVESLGNSVRVRHISAFRVPAESKRAFACSMYLYFANVGDAKIPTETFVCLGGWSNKFVKLRLTSEQGLNTPAEAKSAITDWARHIWP